MVMWTTRQPWTSQTGWFADKVCDCLKSNIWHSGYDWATMGNSYKVPPVCKTCGLFANRVMKCCKCQVYFYQFFRHPKMGYHTKPRQGWYCWSCLQRFLPPAVQVGSSVKLPAIPPPLMVLSPENDLPVGVGYR
jgi:hypothetical protein